MSKKLIYIALTVACIYICHEIQLAIRKHYFPKSLQIHSSVADAIEAWCDVTRDIIIQNDLDEEVYVAPYNEAGINDIITTGNEIARSRGDAYIFVPHKNGWYHIDYPYPYPASVKHKNRRLFVVVPLSQLISAAFTGSVEIVYMQTTALQRSTEEQVNQALISIKDLQPLERIIVKDIQVTFEQGDSNKKWQRATKKGSFK